MNDKQLLAFYNKMNTDCANEEAALSVIREAVLEIYEPLRISKITYNTIKQPSPKRPNGVDITLVLFTDGSEKENDSFEKTFLNTDGRMVTVTFFCKDLSGFKEEKAMYLDPICRQIFNLMNGVYLDRKVYENSITDLQTGLLNLDGLLAKAAEHIGKGDIDDYVNIFMNIKNFNYVNKAFPYEEGTKILVEYTILVKDQLGEGEYISRLGGDNFVVLLKKENLDNFMNFVKDVCIVHKYNDKIKVFNLGIHAGIAYLNGVRNPGRIMEKAAIAYKSARLSSDSDFIVFDDAMYERLMKEREMVNHFNLALESDEFQVYFQPKVRLSDKTLCGAEALARWIIDGDLVSPMEFVPVFESEGYITKLDFYILEKTCEFLKKNIDAGIEVVPISVNFSKRHLDEGDFVDHAVSIIDKVGIDHKYIEVELTETEEARDNEIMERFVCEFKKRGIRTAIDDFGTGFSSLNMLKSVDLDVLKVDKNFIPSEELIGGTNKDTVMFESIIDIAQGLGMETVAEGVETEKQLEYVKSADCAVVQGYIFDKPLTEDEFVERLKNKKYA